MKKIKAEQKGYGYYDFVRGMKALPFMTAIPDHRTWEVGQSANNTKFEGDVDKYLKDCKSAKEQVTLKPKCTVEEYWFWATNGQHTYEELLKYGPNGRKQLLDEDGNPREAKPRGRAKGWRKPTEGLDQVDEFGMNSGDSATSKKKKNTGKSKKEKSSGGNLRIPEMIERGILKVGAVVTIKGKQNSEAAIVDGKTVKFGKKEMGFNEWGILVVGHAAVNIYKHAMYEGKLLQELRSA